MVAQSLSMTIRTLITQSGIGSLTLLVGKSTAYMTNVWTMWLLLSTLIGLEHFFDQLTMSFGIIPNILSFWSDKVATLIGQSCSSLSICFSIQFAAKCISTIEVEYSAWGKALMLVIGHLVLSRVKFGCSSTWSRTCWRLLVAEVQFWSLLV